MWTDHDDVAAMLASLVWAEGEQAQGRRVKASYVARYAYLPVNYEGGLRERVFERSGPQATRDYDTVFGHRS